MSATVVPLRGTLPTAPAVSEAIRHKIVALVELSRDQPEQLTSETLTPDVLDGLKALVVEARQVCAPAEAGEIVRALQAFARRHQVEGADETALELDAEAIAGWPVDLWRRAFRELWERWAYRRMPTVGDFRAVIATELEDRQTRLAKLMTLEARVEYRLCKPRTPSDCIAVLKITGPGTRQGWYQAACRRDPALTAVDLGDFDRWVPTIAARMAQVGLLGRTDGDS
jgi:hypothetical protein